jgi:hypothetical protein
MSGPIVARQFDVYRICPVFGPGAWLERIEARSISDAEKLAKPRHGSSILVTPAMGSVRRAQRTTTQELARKSSPHRRKP